RVQIGIRLVLPLIALAIVGLSAGFARTINALPLAGRRALSSLCGVGIVWMAVSAASIWPDGLRYTNEFWGGSSEGYRLLSDSNYDWGQGLKELVGWQERNNAGPLDVWYFGADPACNRAPLQVFPLHTLP